MTLDFNKIISIIDERIDAAQAEANEIQEKEGSKCIAYAMASAVYQELLYLREVLIEEIECDPL